jgi:hypothetical protein
MCVAFTSLVTIASITDTAFARGGGGGHGGGSFGGGGFHGGFGGGFAGGGFGDLSGARGWHRPYGGYRGWWDDGDWADYYYPGHACASPYAPGACSYYYPYAYYPSATYLVPGLGVRSAAHRAYSMRVGRRYTTRASGRTKTQSIAQRPAESRSPHVSHSAAQMDRQTITHAG